VKDNHDLPFLERRESAAGVCKPEIRSPKNPAVDVFRERNKNRTLDSIPEKKWEMRVSMGGYGLSDGEESCRGWHGVVVYHMHWRA
jgi:hypothetical protein